MVDPNLSGAALIRKVAMYQLDNDTCHSSTQMRSKSWLLRVFHGVSYLQQMFSVNINLSGAACVSKVISAVCCWVGCWWVMQKFGWDNSCGLADPHFSFPTNKQLKSQVLRQCCYNRKGQTQTTPFLVSNTVPRNKARRARLWRLSYCSADIFSEQYTESVVWICRL